MKELIEKIENLNTKNDFVGFLELLILDLKNNADDWNNRSLDAYLEALKDWTEDMDGYYQNNNLSIPENVDWKIFAQMLIAAKMYE